jgi:hypothetical protein
VRGTFQKIQKDIAKRHERASSYTLGEQARLRSRKAP